jgi:hypothetical protein
MGFCRPNLQFKMITYVRVFDNFPVGPTSTTFVVPDHYFKMMLIGLNHIIEAGIIQPITEEG